MARNFNLTANLVLAGPTNLRPIVSSIKTQLSNIKVDVDIKINPATAPALRSMNTAFNTFNATLATSATNIKNVSAALTNLNSAINGINLKSLNQNLNQAAQGVAKVGKAAATTRTELEEFGRVGGLAVRRFAGFAAATGIIMGFIMKVKEGVSEAISFQHQMVRLAQLSGDTTTGMKHLSDKITELSTNLGVSSSKLVSISDTLVQAGLSARDTRVALEALSKTMLAPAFDNIEQTTEGAIAMMAQFKLKAGDLEKALGSMNAVAANFAVESQDLITAVRIAGGSFATMSQGVDSGMESLNKFMALFTSVRGTTRESAESIATGLRTIFTRLERSDTITQLKQLGVELTDLEGKFVGPYEAITRISAAMKRMDPRDLRFAQIAESLGGYRQIGKVIPLLLQNEMAVKALGVAQQGQASLSDAAAKAQESWTVQLTRTHEKFLALMRDISNSSAFKAIIGSVTGLANAFIGLASSITPILPYLSIIMGMKALGAAKQIVPGFMAGIKGRGMAGGGVVPGYGDGDTVPAMLTPGEFVIRKKAVQAIGIDRLHKINKYKEGGVVDPKRGVGAIFLNPKDVSDYTHEIIEPSEIGSKRKNAIQIPVHAASIGQVDVNKFDEALLPGIKRAIIDGANHIQQMTGFRGSPLQKINKIPNQEGISGSIFEGVIAAFGANVGTGEDTRRWDFPSGLSGGISNIFNRPELASDIPVDAKRSNTDKARGSIHRKIVKSLLEQSRPSERKSLTKKDQNRLDLLKTRYVDTGKTDELQNSERKFLIANGINIPSKLKKMATGGPVGRTAMVYDFDDTLAKVQTSNLASFRDSNLVKQATPTALLEKAKLAQFKRDIYVLTARPSITNEAINEFAKKYGLNLSGVIGVGDMYSNTRVPGNRPGTTRLARTADKKALALQELSGKYRSVGFFDDSEENIMSVRNANLPNVKSRLVRGMATGGEVDSVPAMLTPGEFVIRKEAASRLGLSTLQKLNHAEKFATGGPVQRFSTGGMSTEDYLSRAAHKNLNLPIGPQLKTYSKQLAAEEARLMTVITDEVMNMKKLGVSSKALDTAKKVMARALSEGATIEQAVALANKQVINKRTLLGRAGTMLNKVGGIGSAGFMASMAINQIAPNNSLAAGASGGIMGATAGSMLPTIKGLNLGVPGAVVGGMVGAIQGYRDNSTTGVLNSAQAKLETSTKNLEMAFDSFAKGGSIESLNQAFKNMSESTALFQEASMNKQTSGWMNLYGGGIDLKNPLDGFRKSNIIEQLANEETGVVGRIWNTIPFTGGEERDFKAQERAQATYGASTRSTYGAAADFSRKFFEGQIKAGKTSKDLLFDENNKSKLIDIAMNTADDSRLAEWSKKPKAEADRQKVEYAQRVYGEQLAMIEKTRDATEAVSRLAIAFDSLNMKLEQSTAIFGKKFTSTEIAKTYGQAGSVIPNMAENPQAYGGKAVADQYRQNAAYFGLDAERTNEAATRLEAGVGMKSRLINMAKNLTAGAPGEDSVKTYEDALVKTLKESNLKPEDSMYKEIMAEFNKMKSAGGANGQPLTLDATTNAQFTEKLAEQAEKSTKAITDNAVAMMKKRLEIEQNYITALQKQLQTQEKINSMRTNLVGLVQEQNLTLARINSPLHETTAAEANAPARARIDEMGQQFGLGPNQGTNIGAIQNRMGDLLAERDRLQAAGRDNLDVDQTDLAQKTLANAEEIKKGNELLKTLHNDNTMQGNILKEIENIQRKESAIRQGITDVATMSPEQRIEAQRQLSEYARFKATGQAPQDLRGRQDLISGQNLALKMRLVDEDTAEQERKRFNAQVMAEAGNFPGLQAANTGNKGKIDRLTAELKDLQAIQFNAGALTLKYEGQELIINAKNAQATLDERGEVQKAQGEVGKGVAFGGRIGGAASDTVPAWLTPGEFVVNAQAAQANLGLLQAINGTGFASGGRVTDEMKRRHLQSLYSIEFHNKRGQFGNIFRFEENNSEDNKTNKIYTKLDKKRRRALGLLEMQASYGKELTDSQREQYDNLRSENLEEKPITRIDLLRSMKMKQDAKIKQQRQRYIESHRYQETARIRNWSNLTIQRKPMDEDGYRPIDSPTSLANTASLGILSGKNTKENIHKAVIAAKEKQAFVEKLQKTGINGAVARDSWEIQKAQSFKSDANSGIEDIEARQRANFKARQERYAEDIKKHNVNFAADEAHSKAATIESNRLEKESLDARQQRMNDAFKASEDYDLKKLKLQRSNDGGLPFTPVGGFARGGLVGHGYASGGLVRGYAAGGTVDGGMNTSELSTALNNWSGAANNLINNMPKIPEHITVEGTHNHTHIVTGESALAQAIVGAVQEYIATYVDGKMRKTINQDTGETSPMGPGRPLGGSQ